MVDCAALAAYAAAADAAHDDVLRHVEQKHLVHLGPDAGENFVQHLGLGVRAREPVEHVLPVAILFEPLFHEPHDDGIRHELPGLHVALGLEPGRRPRLDRGAQHVARRDVRVLRDIAHAFGQSAFACPWGAQ